ncbi:MAG: hypothetical protein HZB65_01005 [Candidatus Aenigmarchaeota archaeon]|nr:hypothetical protein [Candidatus Aenigmarchaeota archaeon]
MQGISEEYKKLQARFDLPELESLNNVFQFDKDISNIEDMRNEMTNRLFEFSENVVEPLLWCNNHCHMIERDMLLNEENTTLFDIYKQVQSFKWRNHLLSLKPNKQDSLCLIKDLWTFWNAFEPGMSKICRRFSAAWTNLKFKNENVGYHG